MTDKLSTRPADLLASLLALVAKWHEQASRSSIGGDHMDAVEGQTLQLCADELQAAIASLAAHRGEVSAWRVLNIGGDGEHGVWHDYKSGDLHLAGLIAEESEIEYAYKHPPQAQAGAGDAEELQFYRDECAIYRGKVDLLMAEVSQADEEGRAFIHKDTIVAIITHDPSVALEAERER